jgi:sucrose-6-phosphate hydrolase SacC (GH32 family)
VFKAEGEFHRFLAGGNYYAAQTFSDVPKEDGRRIQIGWMSSGKYPGMPFNQQMSFPRALTLRTTPEGARMFCEPVKEIEKLHGKEFALADKTIKPDENLLSNLSGELFDIRAEIEPGTAKEVGFDLRGIKVRYNTGEKKLYLEKASTPLELVNGRITLQILLDRTSIEVFANNGLMNLNYCFVPDDAKTALSLYADGGEAKLVSLRAYELRSIWE